jgi:hypothetical protein
MKEWFNKGTKTEVFIKKTLAALVGFLLSYRIGYVIGAFLANIGL